VSLFRRLIWFTHALQKCEYCFVGFTRSCCLRHIGVGTEFNFGGRHFCPKLYVWKLTKCQNFTWYLPEDVRILHDNCPRNILSRFFWWAVLPLTPSPSPTTCTIAVRCRSGFLVSNSTFKCLVMRYSDQRGQVYFDDFILCAVRLKTMFGRSTLSVLCTRMHLSSYRVTARDTRRTVMPEFTTIQ